MPGGKNAFELFSKTGAAANAFTSHNMTAYLFACSDCFNENLDILLGYVNDPYFTGENVEKEQGIIAQEIKMYDDDPEWKLFNNALTALYHNNTVKDDIAGSVSSIAQIDKDVLYRAYNSFYHPENMVLFIAGEVDLDEIEKIIDKNVEKPEKPFTVERTGYEEDAGVNQNRITKKMSVSLPNFILAFKGEGAPNGRPVRGKEMLKRNLETNLVLKMLFSESAELYNNLYNSGVINDNFSADLISGESYFSVICGGETKSVDKAVSGILSYLDKIKKTGLKKEEYEMAKKASFGRQITAYNSLEAVANSFSGNFFAGIGAFDFIDVYGEITLDSVNERLKSAFNENYSLSEILPG
jgi:predicted Zn-dependent peptidase